MRRALVVAAVLITCMDLFAQQLQVLPDQDPKVLQWNSTFTKRNSIATITGDVSVKRQGERIIKKPTKYLYKFGNDGNIVYRNTSFGSPGSGRDTAFVLMEYDKSGNLTRELSTDLGGHFELSNAYDSSGMLIAQTYGRVANLNSSRYEFEPGERTEISDEIYTYESNESYLKKTYFNDSKLPFREETFHYDELGYLNQIEDIYLMSRRRVIEQFTYDEKGRLKMRIRHSDNGKQPKRYNYMYDSVNNLVKIESFNGTKALAVEEFLYNYDTGLLDARLTKDMATNIIKIVKYNYTFH